MARTAPVPNLPPIPGMCPSIAVLAGGGDGGGGSGNGPGDGSGNAGANGDGSGDGAGGDAVGGGNSGAGSGNGCPNPQHGNPGTTAAGDPIDPVSGRVFTLAALDLALGGPLPFLVTRRYSSGGRRRNVGLGHGWLHTFAWNIATRRASVVLHTGDGGQFTFETIPIGEARKLADGHIAHESDGYRLVGDDGVSRVFRELELDSGEFRLTRVEDGYQNAIQLHYDRGILTHLTDSVGRVVRVDREASGHIAAFSVHVEPENRWHSFVTYGYDEAGDLAVATDARGQRWTYAYQRHLLVRETAPSGRTTHYVYDEDGRCNETWVEPATSTSSEDCSATLADGSRAKGVLHVKVTRQDDYIEVVNSRDVKRYFVAKGGAIEKSVFGGGVHENAFDDWGHLTRYVDALGATWEWTRDAWGRVASATNPQGDKRGYTYDASGRILSVTDGSGRVVHYDRNPQGALLLARDAIGPLIQYDYDSRGLTRRIVLPDGATTRLAYDAFGNRNHVIEPNGSERRIQYDYFGKPTSYLDERGGQTSFAYDPCGRLIRVKLPNGSARHYAYDRDGNLSSVTNELGRQYVLSWGGYKEVHEVRRPDGTVVTLMYDRECELTRVVNQRGETHKITRSPAGRIVKEETFDGRTLRFKTDNQGALEQIRTDRALTTIERDEVGRIISRVFEDGTEHAFEYDLAGRLTQASAGTVTVSFAYDTRGNLVSERQSVDGVEHDIIRDYDERGLCTLLRTSLGHVRTLRFDRMGAPTEMVLDGEKRLSFAYDGGGGEVGRTLPDGATLETSRDVMGWATARRLTSAGGRVTVEQTFRRTEDGTTVLSRDRDRGATEYAYDPVGGLIERIPEKARAEIFRQDGAGAADDGQSSRFAPGGRLVERGGVQYVYDGRGRLVEKRAAGSRSTFEWTASDLLSSVTTADGAVTRYRYDCFSRRVERKRSSRDGSTERTRWIWDREDIVHEVREQARRGGDPVIEERTYVDKPGSMELVAEHRKPANALAQQPEWRFLISDSRWAPEVLVDGAGNVVEEVQLTAFGAPERPIPTGGTVARFAGHWLDEDTGLHYNRHRYFDPETGRYISPEPLGLEGGLMAYTYADQSPYEIVDPNGLLGMNATASGPAGSFTRGSASTEGVPSSSVALHPVVVNALSTTGHHNIPFSSDPRSPRACAEPRAVSDYLHAYEAQHGVALDPDTEEGRGHIHDALSEMHVGANQADNGHPRAPCRNCSQFFANLMEQHGAPSPGNIAEGHRSASTGGGTTNFTPPRPNRPGHRAYPIT